MNRDVLDQERDESVRQALKVLDTIESLVANIRTCLRGRASNPFPVYIGDIQEEGLMLTQLASRLTAVEEAWVKEKRREENRLKHSLSKIEVAPNGKVRKKSSAAARTSGRRASR